jgi:hypothetical protein
MNPTERHNPFWPLRRFGPIDDETIMVEFSDQSYAALTVKELLTLHRSKKTLEFFTPKGLPYWSDFECGAFDADDDRRASGPLCSGRASRADPVSRGSCISLSMLATSFFSDSVVFLLAFIPRCLHR